MPVMTWRLACVLCLLVVAGALSLRLGVRAAGNAPAWTALEPGLEWAEFSELTVRVLRVDTRRFALKLLNASNPKYGESLTAREWTNKHDLVAAINASMYQKDYLSSVSLMKTGGHVNNPRVSRDKSILAFDPVDPALPAVRIIDRECDDLDAFEGQYRSMVQSIRMISCRGRNVWQQQRRRAATTSIGIDGKGRVLLIHVARPMTTHDTIELLKKLPLELDRAMYAEGGSEAQLFVRSGNAEYESIGQNEALAESGLSMPAFPIPNVIGVVRR